MVALLDDPARVHDHDLVGVADRRETVRDDEGGAAVTEARHRLLDEHLGARVDVAGRFVEDEDARIGEERAGDSDELPLACRDVRGFFFEKRVVALGQRAYERIDVGGCRCGDDLVQRGAFLAVGDVVADRACEQPAVLEHHPERPPHRVAG